jgi:transposase
MATKLVVQLGEQQRRQLRAMIAAGRGPARALTHARILLKADRGESDPAIAQAVEVSVRTVERVRRRFVKAGLTEALQRLPQPARPDKRKLDGDAEAHLVTLACSEAPDGRRHWTLQLLADRLVQLKHVDEVSRETVRRTLKKTR